MSGGPTVYLTLCDYMGENNLKFSHKVIGLIGGSAPSPKIIRDSEEVGIDIVHAYGLTESYGSYTIANGTVNGTLLLNVSVQNSRQDRVYPTCRGSPSMLWMKR